MKFGTGYPIWNWFPPVPGVVPKFLTRSIPVPGPVPRQLTGYPVFNRGFCILPNQFSSSVFVPPSSSICVGADARALQKVLASRHLDYEDLDDVKESWEEDDELATVTRVAYSLVQAHVDDIKKTPLFGLMSDTERCSVYDISPKLSMLPGPAIPILNQVPKVDSPAKTAPKKVTAKLVEKKVKVVDFAKEVLSDPLQEKLHQQGQ
ncbi:hypothetical protein PHJA_001417000 [Phtheirospermum japonicum]|uniref:Uncharacterized protein n=1 Tax=Phtheirospermum japonicum TaxID=374723 RepID=A0A830C6K3_9LAMI|nr:hypothetical protein PHJA_001417000 [Phtheirospermum japonicum]